ncbi:lipid droplet-associated hydrolase-like [Varroa jacobsoni]|uniref:Lipid droplet-associated hydrolase n=1 Tax=Varroa destructor TaxID=109461 RepID=A0A7M7K1C5_VARDE|nr:lipid droplet-associated hydrolase-like [Varroa destructor]XP_022659960.1 lipid droplet-associated hydrolase-like [Varroa destructor]XP_022659961.1 lipid droplet-associated hydrolase-like [Varroa destructor]XP_022659962.1 lipid droplet-associated hydrolase-like [Varroa destructor]XP_022659963.1 lipid droplet-associated hydrolase-like [Varroa destructor]XP_022659964.1 lipid droplet-associated hydrolase-like [Varroa destructor]XP_022692946.1 lipid droplet-associated hydrolase-like [Varroa ja
MYPAVYSYEKVRGVSTKILRFEANLRPETDGIWREFPIVIMIPGNPGEIQYYEEFLRQVYGHFEEQVEVVGVSHTGHHAPPSSPRPVGQSSEGQHSQEFPSIDEHSELYDLQAQILHKIEFIKRFIGFEREVILIGHSIGAYVAMQVIKREPRLKCEKAILLFPVIERLISTDRAQELMKTVQRWYSPFLFLCNLMHFTPLPVKRWLATWFCGQAHLGEATASFLCKQAMYSSWFLAKDELNKVDKRDDAFLKRSWRLLSFYYGNRDGWCPIEYFKDMHRDYPQADITLCNENIDHAFVMDERSTRLMAKYTAEKCKGVL